MDPASVFSQHNMALVMAAAAKKIKMENLLYAAPNLGALPPPPPLTAAHSPLLARPTANALHGDEGLVKTEEGGVMGSNGAYFNCTQCQKVFWSESSLKHHCSLYHSEKAFVCEICGKAFRFRSNLAEHRSVHTSLKPYVCKFCGKSSRLKGNLTKHILKHHKKEQNAYIGKDDIIIKKGKKSIKDPVAIDFLEKSMIVLPESSEAQSPSAATLQLFSMAAMGTPPSYEAAAQDWRQGSSASSGSEAGGLRIADSPPRKRPLPQASPAPTELPRTADLPPLPSSTKCSECGKCFRKHSALQVHLSLKHPHVAIAEGPRDAPTPPQGIQTPSPGLAIGHELKELRGALAEGRDGSADRLDAVLASLDLRVARLERQVESSLGSLGSLITLQNSANSAFSRFREEVAGQLKALHSLVLATRDGQEGLPSGGASEHSASSDE